MPTLASVLKNFDLLILDNFTTSALSQQQLAALLTWVLQARSIIVAGGPEWRPTLTPLPAGLLPVTITGTQNTPAGTALLPIGGPSKVNETVPAPIPISTAKTATGGLVIRSSGTTPLIVQAKREQGTVCYLAFDPTLEPIVSWPGTTTLWK